LAFRSHVITEEKAKGVRRVLRWVEEAAPRKREREEAGSLLRVLSGVKGTKQILLTRGQEEMLAFITEEFPTYEPTQLSLLSPQEEVLMYQSSISKVASSKPVHKEKNLPGAHKLIKPKLKTELTEEDKEARRNIGLSSTPSEVPSDTSGESLTSKVAKIQESLAVRDRQFGQKKKVKVEE